MGYLGPVGRSRNLPDCSMHVGRGRTWKGAEVREGHHQASHVPPPIPGPAQGAGAMIPFQVNRSSTSWDWAQRTVPQYGQQKAAQALRRRSRVTGGAALPRGTAGELQQQLRRLGGSPRPAPARATSRRTQGVRLPIVPVPRRAGSTSHCHNLTARSRGLLASRVWRRRLWWASRHLLLGIQWLKPASNGGDPG